MIQRKRPLDEMTEQQQQQQHSGESTSFPYQKSTTLSSSPLDHLNQSNSLKTAATAPMEAFDPPSATPRIVALTSDASAASGILLTETGATDETSLSEALATVAADHFCSHQSPRELWQAQQLQCQQKQNKWSQEKPQYSPEKQQSMEQLLVVSEQSQTTQNRSTRGFKRNEQNCGEEKNCSGVYGGVIGVEEEAKPFQESQSSNENQSDENAALLARRTLSMSIASSSSSLNLLTSPLPTPLSGREDDSDEENRGDRVERTKRKRLRKEEGNRKKEGGDDYIGGVPNTTFINTTNVDTHNALHPNRKENQERQPSSSSDNNSVCSDMEDMLMRSTHSSVESSPVVVASEVAAESEAMSTTASASIAATLPFASPLTGTPLAVHPVVVAGQVPFFSPSEASVEALPPPQSQSFLPKEPQSKRMKIEIEASLPLPIQSRSLAVASANGTRFVNEDNLPDHYAQCTFVSREISNVQDAEQPQEPPSGHQCVTTIFVDQNETNAEKTKQDDSQR